METTNFDVQIGIAFTPGCEPVVEDRERRRLLWLMAEYFRTMGCTDIRARLPGLLPPPVLSGTLEDCRPDLTCVQADSGRTPLLLEVVTPHAVDGVIHGCRWSLLHSAAGLCGAELHFAVPRWTPDGPVEPALRRELAQLDLPLPKIWAV